MKTKCITFDKQAQDALPEEIKAKMKADREKAIMDRQLKKMEKLSKEDIGRVILYRGRKEVSKEWVYGFLTVKPSYGNTQAYYIEYVEELYKDGKFNGLKHHSHRVIPETVGQLVKEYNGARYFKGDIGRTKDEGKLIIILTWIDQHGLFGWLTPEEYEQNKSGNLDFDTILFWTYAFSDDSAKDIEVIGNIFDNPELV